MSKKESPLRIGSPVKHRHIAGPGKIIAITHDGMVATVEAIETDKKTGEKRTHVHYVRLSELKRIE
jgi:hypothetical protein